ncbi:MAG: hypothetical protein C5S43_05820 [Candidatus Methanocomedens sp.]|nr:MAG: hypothetical protein C5S43_05820 [ANME-2 cluster archaeon]
MRKEIVTVLSILAIIILIYSIAKPTHLHQDIKMEYCGDCHTEDSILSMHESVDPMETGCVDAGCHPEAIAAFSVHTEMVPSECDRCHEFGGEPMYSNCDLCHGSYHQLEGRINIEDKPCEDCHESHSLMTDDGCAKCHIEAYNDLKTKGGSHSDISGSCYACHEEHMSIPDCLDCHGGVDHSGTIIDQNCIKCHQAHTPMEVSFDSNTTMELCIECHPSAAQEFLDNPSKHSDINCVECHQDHFQWSPCAKCHEGVHTQLTGLDVNECKGCHGTAHSPSKY